jgi:hypothetical protein
LFVKCISEMFYNLLLFLEKSCFVNLFKNNN